jgi:hypothetical protein
VAHGDCFGRSPQGRNMNRVEQKVTFAYAIRDDKFGEGKVAFLHWLNERGEISQAGVLRGFAQEHLLKRAAETCVDALNSSGIGPWTK